MIDDPRMIQTGMVRHKVEHQLETALLEPFAQSSQGFIAAERLMNRVTGDGEARTGDVILAQVGQRFLKLAPPLGVVPRDALSDEAGLPDAEQPDPIQTA